MPTRIALLFLMPLPLAGQVVSEQHAPIPGLLQAVSAVSAEVAWVSGHHAAVLRTIDGGRSWQAARVTGAEPTLQFRDVEALDAERAWLLSAGTGEQSRIYHTTDGGATWTEQFRNRDSTAFYDCMTFFDDTIGVAFSDAGNGQSRVLRTTDGGAHWQLLPAGAVPAPLTGEGAFAASGSCVNSVDDRHGWIALGSPAARVWTTGDAGAHWTSHSTPIVKGSSAGASAIAFVDPRHGIVVGGDMSSYTTDSSSAAVATTDDGGLTWQLQARPEVPGTPFGVSWVPRVPGAVLIASPGGLSVSADAGRSWRLLRSGVFWSVGASGKTAWAVGAGGRGAGQIVRIDF